MDVIRLVIDLGADLKARDDDGLTPPLLAAVALITKERSTTIFTNAVSILNLILEREELDRKEKISVLELSSAVILLSFISPKPPRKYKDYTNDITENYHIRADFGLDLGLDRHYFTDSVSIMQPGISKEFEETAFQYWHRALELRLMNTEGCKPIPKSNQDNRRRLISEFSTMAELQQIQQRTSEWKLQAFLIQLRILLSQISSRAVFRYFYSIQNYLHEQFNQVFTQSRLSEVMSICLEVSEALPRFFNSNCWRVEWKSPITSQPFLGFLGFVNECTRKLSIV